MKKKIFKKTEIKPGAKKLREWHLDMAKNFDGIAERCVDSGYASSEQYFIEKAVEHRKAAYKIF
tara:strand:+ start:7886 stop:8077 length:192 start_codon:yes stop_codon:yes gene_type:complete